MKEVTGRMKEWKDVHGMFPPKEARALVKLAKDKNCLEIGSYKGRSTIAMASTAKHVFTIDTFRADTTRPSYQIPDNVSGHTTLDIFNRNIKGYDNIEYMIGLSEEILPTLDKMFDLVFIDGCHDKEQVEIEIKLSWDLIKDDGIFIFHDINLGRLRQAVVAVFDESKLTKIHTLAWAHKRDGKKIW